MRDFGLSGPFILPNSGTVERVVVLLHGWGSNGDDLIGLEGGWGKQLANTAFFSPHAPFPFEHGGSSCYQWFSLQDSSSLSMKEGCEQAEPYLDKFLTACSQAYDVKADQMAIVGFSQGGALALHMGKKQKFGAVVSLCGGFFYTPQDPPLVQNPTLLIHGEWDPVVSRDIFDASCDFLRQMETPMEAYVCPKMEHTINLEAMDKTAEFLKVNLI